MPISTPQFYNTLTHHFEPFEPLVPGTVLMHHRAPTPGIDTATPATG